MTKRSDGFYNITFNTHSNNNKEEHEKKKRGNSRETLKERPAERRTRQ
jgi:hypothetical protein